MKPKLVLIILALISSAAGTKLNAQDKIGYINFQMVLTYMPETRTLNTSIETYKKGLLAQIQTKENSYRSYVESVMKKVENGQLTPAQQEQESAKFLKMENEIGLDYEDLEKKVEQRNSQLLTPILSKLEKAIKDVARENSYTFIFNTVDSGGASSLLYGPEDRDITKKVMTKLGIPTGN